ncbi:MAG: hypothetical protein PHR16_01590 [Methylovulum sp.]|nr:hypothetical protein [Methylovulum sp.]
MPPEFVSAQDKLGGTGLRTGGGKAVADPLGAAIIRPAASP